MTTLGIVSLIIVPGNNLPNLTGLALFLGSDMRLQASFA